MRQEVYRVAFDEASAELSEILTKFEQLRTRKDRVEKVVDALKPLVVTSETVAASGLHVERTPAAAPTPVPAAAQPAVQIPAQAPIQVPVPIQAPPMAQPLEYAATAAVPQASAQPAASAIPYPVQQAVEESNDPFARRAETAIGLGSAARDVREYSRLFNTGTSR